MNSDPTEIKARLIPQEDGVPHIRIEMNGPGHDLIEMTACIAHKLITMDTLDRNEEQNRKEYLFGLVNSWLDGKTLSDSQNDEMLVTVRRDAVQ